jgi:uroporphyrinogen decarboxylase
MRQAGRYLPEYNEIRKNLSFLDLTQNPELASEISIQPHRRFQPDGIIMFADILTPLHGAGVPLHFEEKKGPVLEKVVEKESDLSLLDNFDPDRDTDYVAELIKRLRAYIDGLPAGDRPGLLGFAGAPFTMASYLIEGGTSKKFELTKEFLFKKSDLFHRLSDRIADITIDYLRMQMKTGVEAVQLFDSWGGILSAAHYREFVSPYLKRIISTLRNEFGGKESKPVIMFVGNSSHLLGELNTLDSDAISLDWRTTPEEADRFISKERAVQGNMDPMILYGTPERTEKEARAVLEGFNHRDGYVFNLGHGIHPKASLDCVEAMVKTVKNYRR